MTSLSLAAAMGPAQLMVIMAGSLLPSWGLFCPVIPLPCASMFTLLLELHGMTAFVPAVGAKGCAVGPCVTVS